MPKPSRKTASPRRPAAKRREQEPVTPPPARREEVLEKALALIADHGIAGASLRKLAAELGMSQPSLYHYFTSKDELISQIIEYCAQRMLGAAIGLPPPKSAADLPRFVRDSVLALYRSETHPRFVRFMFIVAMESKQHRAFIEKIFEERLNPGFAILANAFGQSTAERAELAQVSRMVVYSLGLMLLEQRALYRRAEPSADVLAYSDWVVSAGERLMAGVRETT